jgi:hypothetical protein
VLKQSHCSVTKGKLQYRVKTCVSVVSVLGDAGGRSDSVVICAKAKYQCKLSLHLIWPAFTLDVIMWSIRETVWKETAEVRCCRIASIVPLALQRCVVVHVVSYPWVSTAALPVSGGTTVHSCPVCNGYCIQDETQCLVRNVHCRGLGSVRSDYKSSNIWFFFFFCCRGTGEITFLIPRNLLLWKRKQNWGGGGTVCRTMMSVAGQKHPRYSEGF